MAKRQTNRRTRRRSRPRSLSARSNGPRVRREAASVAEVLLESPVAYQAFERTDHSLLDVLDHLLIKGVVARGEVWLGVAGVDLIYLQLSALLCAADRVLPVPRESTSGRRSRLKRIPRRKRGYF